MKERPIIFSAPMVRAILEGRKTQTRRILRPQPQFQSYGTHEIFEGLEEYGEIPLGIHFSNPKYSVGDRLWVRETWRPKTHEFPIGAPFEYQATAACDLTPLDGRWKPSIHMPRTASRLLLEITDVRIERLHDISERDAIAEGVEVIDNQFFGHPIYKDYQKPGFGYDTARLSYYSLWCSIYSHEVWNKNPLVWVISFKKID
jgi:hypothetical protein